MDDLLFKIIYLAITVIAAIVVRYVVPFIKSKTDDTKFLELKSFIRKAIAWAETEVKGSGMGETKFRLVLKEVITWINQKGVNITEEQAKILIQGIFAEVDGYTVNKPETILDDAVSDAVEDVLDEVLEVVTTK